MTDVWQTLGDDGAFAAVLAEAARKQRCARAAALTPDDPHRPVFRCAYCGFPSRGESCGYHADLTALEAP